MMYVEIDNSDTAKSMRLAGMRAADGDVVENTESHWDRRFRMVTGRPDRAEGVSNLAAGHRVDGRANRARGAECRLSGTERHDRVGIESYRALVRNARQDLRHMVTRMRAGDLINGGLRRLATVELVEGAVPQRGLDRFEARG